MKVKVLILSILCVFSVSGFSQKLTPEQEKQARNMARSYCNLLKEFVGSHTYVNNKDKIMGLFSNDIGDAYDVFDDMETMRTTVLAQYLGTITAKYVGKTQINFTEDIDKVEMMQYKAPNRKKESVENVEFVVTKNISGVVNRTVKNSIVVNTQTGKLALVDLYKPISSSTSIVIDETESASSLWLKGLKYYNAKPKQYENAFACFKKAAEMGNNAARYYLAIMLLKGQGCKHIPTKPANVRKAEAEFWLRKLVFSDSYYKSNARNIFAVFSVKEKDMYKDNEDTPYNEGLIKIWKGSEVGFANEAGKIIIPCKYKDTLGFSEGLAAVENKNNLWGFIDKNNNVVINFQYDECNSFRENLACVGLNNKKGFINKDGKIIIPLIYDDVGNFEESYPANENIKLAVVKLNDKFYKLGSDGKIYYEKDKNGTWKKFVN